MIQLDLFWRPLQMQMKVCPRCRMLMPVSKFNRRRSGGPSAYCTICQRAYCREHYLANSALHNKRRHVRTQESRRALRALVAEYREGKRCVDCGEQDKVVLEFDHVRGVKRGEISTMIRNGVTRSAMVDELNKCEIRCANCHRRRTAVQLGWKVADTGNRENSAIGR